MSFKSLPSKEFLKFYHLHNSQDTEKIDIAFACWSEMQKIYLMAIEGRKEFRAALRECRAENKSLKREIGGQ